MQGPHTTQSHGHVTIMRIVLIGFVIVIAIVMMVWLHQEQRHLQKCTDFMLLKSTEQKMAPPVEVIVHIDEQNKTKNATAPSSVDNTWNYNWDRKAWKDASEANGVPMRTIILVRHGQYDFNTGLLNTKGRQQANLTGMRLKELNMPYDRIIHSNMIRAVETADLIHTQLPNLPNDQDPILAEGGPVPPDPTVGYWSLPERTYFVDGPRLEAAFRKYFYRADKTQTRETIDILVGHGNIFRYLILRALQLPSTAWMRVFIPHGSISLLHINSDGTITLTKFGDSGHLPPDLVTI